MLSDAQKKELEQKVEYEYGIEKLFIDLGLKEVSSSRDNVYCVCPFHTGADNPTGFAWSNGFGYCFTQCHRKFDLYSIVMKAKNCDFTEAIGYLAEKVGYDLDYAYTQRTKIAPDSKANTEFLSQLRNIRKKKARKVWKPIDPKILDEFERKLHKQLRDEGYDETIRDYFDIMYAQSGYMEHRIIVPIDYITGELVTVSGRATDPDAFRRFQIWFDTDKSVTCYNISRALPYIEIMGFVIVTEGFKSVWRLHQWGYRNAVALMGNSMSDEQKKMLLKLGVRILIVGDKDEAGKVLNSQVVEEISDKKLAEVEVIDLYKLSVAEKSSIDDITKEQFESLIKEGDRA